MPTRIPQAEVSVVPPQGQDSGRLTSYGCHMRGGSYVRSGIDIDASSQLVNHIGMTACRSQVQRIPTMRSLFLCARSRLEKQPHYFSVAECGGCV